MSKKFFNSNNIYLKFSYEILKNYVTTDEDFLFSSGIYSCSLLKNSVTNRNKYLENTLYGIVIFIDI